MRWASRGPSEEAPQFAHYDAPADAAACRNRRQAAGSSRRQRVRQRSGKSSRAQVAASMHHGRAWPSGTMTLDDEDLFGDHVPERAPKAAGKAAMRKKVVITVKAALNPSERHGENVCVAGIEFDELGRASWIGSADQLPAPATRRPIQEVGRGHCRPRPGNAGRTGESWNQSWPRWRRSRTTMPGWPTRRGSNRPALLLTQFWAVVAH
jgi:hypothetical protein